MATILQSPKRTTRAVIPRPGESQPAFAIRYHESMKTRIPDTDARNRAMFAAWDRHGETDDCEKIARKNFPESKFVRVTNVPYLQEHSIKREDGETDVYDRNRLAQMVQANNHRAADVGLFAPLSEGHTPEDSTVTSPPVLGYAGCYRLGMIGRKRPRWCIFANEFHFRDDAERLRKMARRSPEV